MWVICCTIARNNFVVSVEKLRRWRAISTNLGYRPFYQLVHNEQERKAQLSELSSKGLRAVGGANEKRGMWLSRSRYITAHAGLCEHYKPFPRIFSHQDTRSDELHSLQ